ncbi:MULTISPECIES: DUF1161 domain-containing protein [unclassified Variovorax]|uniref:DUF1161 domain-containing protein n=1 Tax=unclassified Variovorax TaxID=663243 RepID=UPI00076C6987|nr:MULTISPECIES: DUF1161 domain-containing protein [unclassified Variovorax]KWT64111.1 hypothetical protein APY03_7810 [Variovorax sp. WDL1]PNG58916.1 hypothetical protein CHC07_00641 [Variovorax sp. B4]PNG61294.1 hypothetical protein CHC06_01195 [Variovorax sp. B2]VTV12717.1 hypothetical protein WDL1CHR_03470 [Variovorax sp. WDL1]
MVIARFCMARPCLAAVALAFAGAAHAVGCEELAAQIDAKIRASGVSEFTLTTVDAAADAGGRVVGTCELGTKKIVYERGGTHGAVSATRPAQQPAPAPARSRDEQMLTECRDGTVRMGGDCRR